MANPKAITAELICIGDELLIGQTINTNAAWIGEKLSEIGVRPKEVYTIPDDHRTIVDHLACTTSEVVLLTGGLGPTKDDITKIALCEFFDTELVRDKELEGRIVRFFKSIGKEALDVNKAQADLPASCISIPNELGTARGMWFNRNGRVFVSMPGVPYEMKGMMRDTILPELKKTFHTPNIVHRTIQTTGLGESHLAERISDWEDSLVEENIKLAYLPSPGIVKLRLSTYAGNGDAITDPGIDRKVEELRKIIPDLIFGEGKDTLEKVVGETLAELGQTIGTAESCTGGALAERLTSVPGSSRYYVGSFITYLNKVKEEQLGVRASDIEQKGAVSQTVVEQMAIGARERLRVDWVLSSSGVAGPDGGTEEKPVGMVWIGLAGPTGVHSLLLNVPGERGTIIRRTCQAALNILRGELKKQQSQAIVSE